GRARGGHPSGAGPLDVRLGGCAEAVSGDAGRGRAELPRPRHRAAFGPDGLRPTGSPFGPRGEPGHDPGRVLPGRGVRRALPRARGRGPVRTRTMRPTHWTVAGGLPRFAGRPFAPDPDGALRVGGRT